MPKISNKTDKSLYMSAREDLGLTRQEASDSITMEYISPDR